LHASSLQCVAHTAIVVAHPHDGTVDARKETRQTRAWHGENATEVDAVDVVRCAGDACRHRKFMPFAVTSKHDLAVVGEACNCRTSCDEIAYGADVDEESSQEVMVVGSV
jgi:hypothetical protein